MSISRRKALLLSGVAATTIPLVSKANTQNKTTFDETYDIVIVGSGIAGTVAAIRAAESGASVLLLEKMNRLGGTSRFSGLNFACVGSPAQKEKGVVDSPESLARDMYKVSGGFGNYELALHMARNTSRAEEFLRKYGVKWDGRLLKLGGHSSQRCLIPEGDGAGALKALWASMEKFQNITVKTNVKVDEVIFVDGVVSGVEARINYVFNGADSNDDINNKSGQKRKIEARKAVIFATGGYARDKAFRAIEVPFLAGVSTTTSEGATAGALKTLVKAGARPIHLGLYRFAYPLPTEDMVWGMLIDPATGARFISEGSTRNTLAEATLKLRLSNGDKKPFMVYDEKALGKFHNLNRVGRSLNGLNGIDGTMYKFDSLAEVAKFYGTDPKALEKTLHEYNAQINLGKDAFDKPLIRTERKVEALSESGPFYAIVISPRLNFTPGGIKFNKKAQVLSMFDDSPIERLYVCGEAAGGMHGAERMTACSMPACSVFGLIAGEEAAKLTSRS